MPSFNRITLVGNLTKDPDLRYTPSGMAVVNFDIAVNRVYKNKEGKPQEETLFIRVVAFGKQAEMCKEMLNKGKGVFVDGQLRLRTWTRQNGEKRSIIEVWANPFGIIPIEKVKREMYIPDHTIPEEIEETVEMEPEIPEEEVPF